MFDLTASQHRAAERLQRHSKRGRRSDAGQTRLPSPVLAELRSLLLGPDRPRMADVQRHLAGWCRQRDLRAPSRAGLYNAVARIPAHTYAIAALQAHVRAALYNLEPDAEVPGHQLAFYCFNYGSLDAVSYASGLPWLDLYQAARLRGWRPRSRGLLEAVMRARGMA